MILKSILDTDILSEYLKGHNPAVVDRAARYAREYGVFRFTSVTVYEIAYGLEVKGAQIQLRKVMAWLDQNDPITPIAEDYIAVARIRATARKQRAPLELPDCLIAAVAVRMDRPVVTGTRMIFGRSRKPASI